MPVCLVHQNLPAQYRHPIAALMDRGEQVLVLGEQSAAQRGNTRHPHVRIAHPR